MTPMKTAMGYLNCISFAEINEKEQEKTIWFASFIKNVQYDNA